MRVLVVDDSAFARRRIGRMLREGGHEVVEADGFGAALRLVAEGAFDAATVDQLMPEADGLTLVRTLRASRPDLRLVVVSADIQRASREAALAAGADAFVGKSEGAEELLRALVRPLPVSADLVLTSEQRDAFAEMLNVAIGRSAQGLEALLDHRVRLEVPRFEILRAAALPTFLEREAPQMDAIVYQPISGAVRSLGALLFPAGHAVRLLRALPDVGPDAGPSLGEQTVLAEVGNVLLGALTAGLADRLATRLSLGLPVVLLHQSSAVTASLILCNALQGHHAVVLFSRLEANGQALSICLTLFLPDEALRRLVERL